MAELKIEGGNTAATAAVKTTGKAVALNFSKPDEIEVYNSLQKLADDKDYTLSKLIVRVLTGKEEFPVGE